MLADLMLLGFGRKSIGNGVIKHIPANRVNLLSIQEETVPCLHNIINHSLQIRLSKCIDVCSQGVIIEPAQHTKFDVVQNMDKPQRKVALHFASRKRCKHIHNVVAAVIASTILQNSIGAGSMSSSGVAVSRGQEGSTTAFPHHLISIGPPPPIIKNMIELNVLVILSECCDGGI
jgi:hypothetical protein